MNGITEEEESCPVCNCSVMREIDGVVTYHKPEDCLERSRIMLMEQEDQWEIRVYDNAKPPPMGVCASREHAHENWQEYRECYSKLKEKFGLCKELHDIRGAKTHELC